MNRILTALLPCVFAMSAIADDLSSRLQNLGEREQALKQEMLEVGAEIERIEQQLFPAEARIRVYLSVPASGVEMGSAVLMLDGALVESHVYTGSDNRALASGGIQKLFDGHILQGQHNLLLQLTGIDATGKSFERSSTTDFIRNDSAVVLEARLEGAGNGLAITFRGSLK
jgi:uncharacterized protein (DUF1501 family)